MAKSTRTPDIPADAEFHPRVEAVLMDAFRTIEGRPVPEALGEQIDRLATPQRRPDRRS